MKIEKYLCIDKAGVAHGGKIYSREKIESLEIPEWEEIFVPLSSAKWAIKRTPENAAEVNRWANEKETCDDFVGKSGFLHSHRFFTDNKIAEGYTEIDFETFKEITGMGEEKPKQLLGEKEAVHCPTLELAEKVIEILKENGYNPMQTAKEYWGEYGNYMTFVTTKGTINKFQVAPDKYWTERGYTIIPAEKFIEKYEASQQKIFTIEDVRNGKCAIENDGTAEELNKVLKAAFPNDKQASIGTGKFYARSIYNDDGWNNDQLIDLPTQSVKLFISQIEGWKEQSVVSVNGKIQNEDCYNLTKGSCTFNESVEDWSRKSMEILQNSRTEEWQPKWGEQVEGRYEYGSKFVKTVKGKYLSKSNFKDHHLIETEEGDFIGIYPCTNLKKSMSEIPMSEALEIIAQAKGINVNQIKIVE